ncbi:MAG: hypothetical protein JWP97_1760 [Labilithrix sp.]|nr:hypothetical protein [Labilithrix sp.]
MNIRTTFAAAALTCLGLAASTNAHAQEAAPAPATATPAPQPAASPLPERNVRPSYDEYRRTHGANETRWYGWQTLVVDGATLLIGGAAAGGSDQLGAGIIVGGYFLGGPIVHWAHGNVGMGFADLGIRIGAPLVLGVGGYYASGGGSHNGGDDLGPALVGVLGTVIGVASAIAIDAAVLAREPVNKDDDEEEDAKNETPAYHKVASRNPFVPGSLTPTLGPRQDVRGSSAFTGGMIGLSAALY